MILYDTTITMSLAPFGILIPVRDSRATRTFDALSDHPTIGPDVERWHHPTITERLSREDLLRVHSPGYVQRLHSDGLEAEILSTYELIAADGSYHRYAPETARYPLSRLFERMMRKAAGSAQCARLALAHGFCFYFGGGMHHAYRDYGSGFCLINDIVIAARKLKAEGLVQRVWIIDVDAHKGDGTAALTAEDGSIVTLSVHMASGWPLDGPRRLENGAPNPAFIPSDIDIPIETGEEPYYIDRLRSGLEKLERMDRADLAIVVDGADPFEGDELPSTSGLKLSLDQMLARDRLIYRFLRHRGVPAAFLMAGGYGDDVWQVYARFLTWVLGDAVHTAQTGG
jgi:acetoin utilization deacetylase AcuC-like enzyme